MQFELSLWFSGEHGSWSDSHRFPGRPETDTVKALMAHGTETYVALYDEYPESTSCTLSYLEPEDPELPERDQRYAA